MDQERQVDFADDGDAPDANQDFVQAEIDRLEARMDELRDRIESCRKAILLSRAGVLVAGALLALALFGVVRSTPLLLLAMAGVMAGLVGAGSNQTTSQQAHADLATSRAERDALIDGLAPRVLH